MEKIEFTRTELYDLVWSEPLSRLARKYSMSDNGLRKICKKNNIPLPVMGHWQRVQYGYKVTKTKLPTDRKNDQKITLCYRDKDGKYIDVVESPVTKHKKELKQNQELKFIFPKELENPDILIKQAQKTLLSGKHTDFQREGIVFTAQDELPIEVSKALIGRALLFMDTLIKLLRKRNHDIQESNNSFFAIIDGEKFHIRLREKRGMVKGESTWGGAYSIEKYFPKGILTFETWKYSWHTKAWTDGNQKIEEKLLDILSYLEIKAK